MVDLDGIRKHMAARDHYDLLNADARRLVYMTLADDVPDLVAEVERLREAAKLSLEEFLRFNPYGRRDVRFPSKAETALRKALGETVNTEKKAEVSG
jgi:hypothetical protein